MNGIKRAALASGLMAMAACSALIPAAHAQTVDARVVGEVRLRTEAESPAAVDTGDVFSLLRARLGVEGRLSPRSLIFVQVQDARTFGEEQSTTDGTADRLDVHQAWLQYGRGAGDYAWAIRAGRQEIVLGNERLVGAVGWSNTGRAFDGARITFGPPESWQVSALAAVVQERGRRLTGSQEADHLLLGGALDAKQLELYALHDRDATYRDRTNVHRTTAAARVATPPNMRLHASLEAAYQFGSQSGPLVDIMTSQDIAAWLVGARTGFATRIPLLPRLGIGIDVLSGDDPSDAAYNAFNTLYATNHKFYGYIDFFLDPAARTGDRGLIDGMASASVGLPGDVNLDVDVHGFWLQQDLQMDVDRLIGWEVDVTLPVRIGAGQQLQLGYSAFRNGPAAEFIGLGRERHWSHWAYLQAAFAFGGGVSPLR